MFSVNLYLWQLVALMVAAVFAWPIVKRMLFGMAGDAGPIASAAFAAFRAFRDALSPPPSSPPPPPK